jgi:hypothetical protein
MMGLGERKVKKVIITTIIYPSISFGGPRFEWESLSSHRPLDEEMEDV